MTLKVYGQDHSPWVQAVLLSLYDRGVAHSLTIVPPIAVFTRWGVLMPAARFDAQDWMIESANILQELGYEEVTDEDMLLLRTSWLGVTHRVKSTRRFFTAASALRDPSPSRWCRARNQFVRSFVVLYFYLLNQFVVRAKLLPDPEDFAQQFLCWEDKLESAQGNYLGGEEPSAVDMILFGMVQCHCTIHVPPVDALRDDPRLTRVRSWIATLQARFAGYPHLYSGIYFAPYSPAPIEGSVTEKVAFWIGLAFMLMASPITIPLIVLLAMRVPRTQ